MKAQTVPDARGLVPGIHVLRIRAIRDQDVDGRGVRRRDVASRFLPGHDGAIERRAP